MAQSSSTPCKLCSGWEIHDLYRSYVGEAGLLIVICNGCGLVWAEPLPDAERLDLFFARHYGRLYRASHQPRLNYVHKAGRAALNRFKQIRRFLKPGASILDFRSRGGEFIYLLRKLGFDAYGFESHEGLARHSEYWLGVPVQKNCPAKFGNAEQTVDVATLYHVLEYQDDPAGMLGLLHNALNRDGILAVEVSNLEATCRSPIHRFHAAQAFYFNHPTLVALLQNAGYDSLRSNISSDGSNLSVIAKRANRQVERVCKIPGNCERISDLIRRHSLLRHLCSPNPYLRPWQKLKQAFQTWTAVRQTRYSSSFLERIEPLSRRIQSKPAKTPRSVLDELIEIARLDAEMGQ